MGSLMNRLKDARKAMFPESRDQAGDPLAVDIPGPGSEESD